MKESNDRLRKTVFVQPFDFDELIKKYNEKQLNALSYKIINHVRNTPGLDYLLEIWENRAKTARESLNLPSNPHLKDLKDSD